MEHKETDDARGEMVGTLNHKINNPLAAVLGNVELLLLDNSLCIKTRSKLTNIKELSLRIRDVVREFTIINCHITIKYNRQIDMVDVRR